VIELIQSVWLGGLRDAVDILIVAYIFYHLMLLIRGTRSVQVLQGILFLVIATFFMKEVLSLPMLSWLLRKFWAVGLVVLTVVFQPEIRSALAHLGTQPISRWILPSRFDFINEICAALNECSEKRIGALLVLEQETGLKNFIETGTRINGDVSTELILSLLHPRSPLHDGAIIFSGNQLVAAGCVLPLTDDPDFAKLLGTRHRAAVGLSECSDALVLVVSEETGHISLARDGRLQRGTNIDELRDQLHDLFRAKSKRPLLRKPEPPKENHA
jgi:diadenylate cyclase